MQCHMIILASSSKDSLLLLSLLSIIIIFFHVWHPFIINSHQVYHSEIISCCSVTVRKPRGTRERVKRQSRSQEMKFGSLRPHQYLSHQQRQKPNDLLAAPQRLRTNGILHACTMTQLRRSSKDLTATRTATTTDAEFRLQEDDKTEEVFLEFLRALPAEG